jgi:hypothetical protein
MSRVFDVLCSHHNALSRHILGEPEAQLCPAVQKLRQQRVPYGRIMSSDAAYRRSGVLSTASARSITRTI